MRLFKGPIVPSRGRGQGGGGVRTMRGVGRARSECGVKARLRLSGLRWPSPAPLGVHTLRSMSSVRSFFSSTRFLQSFRKYSRFLLSRMAVSSRYCSWF